MASPKKILALMEQDGAMTTSLRHIRDY